MYTNSTKGQDLSPQSGRTTHTTRTDPTKGQALFTKKWTDPPKGQDSSPQSGRTPQESKTYTSPQRGRTPQGVKI